MNSIYDFGPDDPVDSSVLLALAKFAADDGSNCFPSISTIAKMVRRSERTVIRCIESLEKGDWLTVIRGSGRGVVSQYQLNVSRIKTCQAVGVISEKGDSGDMERVTPTTQKGDSLSEKGDSGDGLYRRKIIKDQGKVSGNAELLTPLALDEEGEIPDGLTPLQYADWILEKNSIVAGFGLRDRFARTVSAISRSEAVDMQEATRRMRDRVEAAQGRGETVNAFWIDDSRWKPSAANGKSERQRKLDEFRAETARMEAEGL